MHDIDSVIAIIVIVSDRRIDGRNRIFLMLKNDKPIPGVVGEAAAEDDTVIGVQTTFINLTPPDSQEVSFRVNMNGRISVVPCAYISSRIGC